MLLIRGGRVYGTSSQTADILVVGDRVARISEEIPETGEMTVVDVTGFIVAPGLVDMHVHFRDPGFQDKEDILSGASAAAAGGVTTCCCMPNTSPVVDNAEVVRYVAEKAKKAPVRVLTYGAVTMGQKGRELADFSKLISAGAIAMSDDGNPVQSAELMHRAMLLAHECGIVLISHCEDAEMAENHAVNEGAVSRALGLPGRPAIAEEIMVTRDAMLAAATGAKLHIAHVSTAGSVDIIRKAKAAGVAITAETCPQYFTLTEDEVFRQGALARVNPPLRSESDVQAVICGLTDGTIDAIATDHAPHSAKEKELPLTESPSGMIGLETSLSITLTSLYHTGKLSIDEIVALMSVNPAQILDIDAGTLRVGDMADIVIFNPDEEWTVDPSQLKSKSRNTPFAGMKLRGKVKYTVARGEIVYREFGTFVPSS